MYFWICKPSWTRNSFLAVLRHDSSKLDVQMLISRQLITVLIGTQALFSGWTVATHGVRWLDRVIGVPATPQISEFTATLLYSFTLFVCWDLSRFVVHLLMHRVPFLWAFHQVHHSAEVLTPLTFHRIHPIESWIYTMRGAIVTGVLAGLFYWFFRDSIDQVTIWGVPALGFLFNVAFGNLRHSHVWIRFPKAVELWFLSPAQHQIHHSKDPMHYGKNYGTWLAIWDRALGSLFHAEKPPQSYGVSNPNHQHNLLSAWFEPFRSLFPLAMLLCPVFVLEQEAVANPTEDPQSESEAEKKESSSTEDVEGSSESEELKPEKMSFAEEMIVYSDDQTLRVAGSAQKVSQEQLELFEFDNIEQVLQQVPGVATRNEDGFGLRPNIGIRGANSDRSAKISLMEDGVLLAPAPYAAPAAYYFPMSTRAVGVEVFKGPAATRHGPYTIGGALNVMTRDVPETFSYTADLAGGLRDTYKGHVWVGQRWNRFGILLEGAHLQSSGFKNLDGGGETGFQRTELMSKGELRLEKSAFELKLGYAHEQSNETYLGLSYDDLEDSPYRRYVSSNQGDMAWNRTQAELSWRFQPTTNIRIHTVAYHHWLDRSWTKLNGFRDGTSLHQLLSSEELSGQAEVYMAILKGEEDSTTTGQYLQIGTNHRVFHSYGIQSKAQWEHYGQGFTSVLEVGARLHADDVIRIHTEDAHMMQSSKLEHAGFDQETMLDSHATAKTLALHLHEDLSFDWLHLFPSVRLELIQGQREDLYAATQEAIVRPTLLPGFATLVDLGSWTDFFVGVHRGFSPVSPGQPEDVKPEVSWNYEAGFRGDFGNSHAEVVGFFNDYENLMGQCSFAGGCTGTDIDQQYNGGSVWIYGLEGVFSTDFKLSPKVSIPLGGSLTFNRSAFQTAFQSSFHQFGSVQEGDQLPYLPDVQSSLLVGLNTERLSLSSSLSHRSSMLDEAGVLGEEELEIPSLLLLNAAADVQLTKRFSLYVSGTNLTNAQNITSWRPFGARPIAPLQVMAGLKIHEDRP
ncbi:MAG: ligand-gated channel protein [Proteobacteria bacterium]|nr:ligand-gated channel protein [Pseudomonadota bacterium]